MIEDVIEWDIQTWSRALTFWEKQSQSNFKQAHVLELGARQGGLSLWFAKHGSQVVCSDIKSPEETAKSLHTSYEVIDQITYRAIDACSIPEQNKYDIITFKSILGGIARNGQTEKAKQVIEACFDSLKPGGELLFCENLSATWIHHLARTYLIPWGKEWTYLNLDTLLTMLSPYELKWQSTGFLSAFGRSEKQKHRLSQWDQKLIRWKLPESWRYVFMAVARKPKSQS